MVKVRRIVHPKLKPLHYQIATYYLSDANYPTDNPSQTDNPSLVWKRLMIEVWSYLKVKESYQWKGKAKGEKLPQHKCTYSWILLTGKGICCTSIIGTLVKKATVLTKHRTRNTNCQMRWHRGTRKQSGGKNQKTWQKMK